VRIGGFLDELLRNLRLHVPFERFTGGLKDSQLYRPLFSPWRSKNFHDEIQPFSRFTLVSPERLYVLKTLASQAVILPGEFWECGVYRGGTAMLLAKTLERHTSGEARTLRLFDTFQGMPAADSTRDFHREGDFSETSLESVRKRFPEGAQIHFHPGIIPHSFQGLDGCRIAFAHVDVDIHRSVLDCCTFIYPRLVTGGFLVVDDYGFPSCPGAREAVDSFFSDKPERPLVLPTGQAVIFVTPRPGG
jgi:O-methyltransferase